MPGDAAAVRAQCIRLIIAAILTTLPELNEAMVRAVVTRACHPKGPARQIAADLFDEPSLLTSGSSHSVRATQQLTDALVDAGVPGVVRPRCGSCGRSRLFKTRLESGQMACDDCWKKSKQEPCACCEQPGFMSFRGMSGQGICGTCRARPACRDWCDDQERMAAALGPIRPRVHNPHGDGDSRCRMCQRVRHPLSLVDDMYFLCGTCTSTYRSLAPPTHPHRQSRFRRGQATVLHESAFCDVCDQRKTAGGLTTDGAVLCGSCWRNRNYPPCADCETKLPPGGHNEKGAPVCKACWYRRGLADRPRAIPKPRPVQPTRACIRCGWSSRNLRDGPSGPACIGCCDYVRRTATELGIGAADVTIGLRPAGALEGNICDRCGKTVKAIGTRRTGERICKICAMRPQLICAGCGHPREHDPKTTLGACPGCRGTALTQCRQCDRSLFALLPARHQPRCLFCRAGQWVRTRLGDTVPAPVDPRLDSFIDRLAATHDFPQLRQWFLRSPAATALLTRMAHGQAPIDHDTLDALAGDRGGRAISVEHLRRLLVAAGALPPREEYLARLEAAFARLIEHTPGEDQMVIARYVQWQVLPGVRRRLATGRDPQRTCTLARGMLYGPGRLIDELHSRGEQIGSLRQPVLDQWLARRRSDATSVSVFLRWAMRHRLAPSVALPVQRMNDPMDFNDPDQQWQLLRRCLHDDTLSPRVRLAGTLVLMYGQHASTVVQLRASHVTPGPPTTLRLGADAVDIAEPIATVLRHTATGTISTLAERGIANSFDTTKDRWLFPGRGPGKRLGTEALLNDLRHAGIRSRHARNTTLLTLARELPPAVLADLLGIGTSTADRWRQWAGGTWAAYEVPSHR